MEQAISVAEQIKSCREQLTRQEFKTLMGQVKHNESMAALKGLKKLLRKKSLKKEATVGGC